jgi:hypothetical protein
MRNSWRSVDPAGKLVSGFLCLIRSLQGIFPHRRIIQCAGYIILFNDLGSEAHVFTVLESILFVPMCFWT